VALLLVAAATEEEEEQQQQYKGHKWYCMMHVVLDIFSF